MIHVPITSVEHATARLAEYVDLVSRAHERVVITRNGEPSAVLISLDDLESMEETIALLSDSDALEEIYEARRAVARGEVINAAHIRLRSAR